MLALPLAGALSVGVDASSVGDMKNAGASPAYGQVWVGTWTKSSGGWSTFESSLRTLRDQGVTPVVMWYYWGDSISVDAVKYGKDGRSKGDWDWMASELARRANSVMGGREFIVVLEPEFNKAGVSSWETFDGYLADQAWKIRGIAPSAKIVTGFGHWGGWDIFDRAMGASHYAGFQLLRGSTRDSSSQGENVVDDMLRITKSLKSKFGKSVFMYDLAIATYGGWEGVQERGLQRVIGKLGELESAGMKGLVWRYVYDNSYSSGYYGPAESSWGVKYSWGAKKPAFDELVTLIKNGGSSSGSSGGDSAPAPAPAPSSGGTSSETFRNVKGNAWWIQTDVSGSPTWVAARVNGGSWVTLPKAWWGSYAASVPAPSGSTVELIAKFGDGSERTAAFAWPSATPVSGSGGGSSSGGAFDASFANVKGNEWWIQADINANEPIQKVDARVNGGAWKPLDKKWWGSYATSMHAPGGSNVEIRATGASGSETFTTLWLR